MRHDILGINVLVFVLVVWMAVVVALWMMDNLPEIWEEHRIVLEDAATVKKDYEAELTVEMPAGSFDPDETMQLAIQKYRTAKLEDLNTFEATFVINKRHAPAGRRRHAKA